MGPKYLSEQLFYARKEGGDQLQLRAEDEPFMVHFVLICGLFNNA
jgi:hypothetical protein